MRVGVGVGSEGEGEVKNGVVLMAELNSQRAHAPDLNEYRRLGRVRAWLQEYGTAGACVGASCGGGVLTLRYSLRMHTHMHMYAADLEILFCSVRHQLDEVTVHEVEIVVVGRVWAADVGKENLR